MAEREVRLNAIVQETGEGIRIGQVLFWPEFVVCGASDSRLRSMMRDAVRFFAAEAPAYRLHSRLVSHPPVIERIIVELEPPGRSVAWEQPIPLEFAVIRWKHGAEGHVAYVPSLNIEIFSGRETELKKLVVDQIRQALVRTKATKSLPRLIELQRSTDLRIIELEMLLPIKSLKQAALEREQEAEESRKRVIDQAGVDLTGEKAPRPPQAYEVAALVATLAEALSGAWPRSVLLVGRSGVGKTAIFHELVRRRADFELARTPFWATSGSRLIAGMSGFGKWQERCQQLCREGAKERAIVHLGNLIELMGVGKTASAGQSVAGFLRPYLARAELLGVAECTQEQIPVIERENPHLLAAFYQINVDEPDAHVCAMILLQRAIEWQGPAGSISEATLETIDRLHRRYATYSAFPGRPLRFLRNLIADSAASANLPPRALTAQDATEQFARETGLPRFMIDDTASLDLDAARDWFASRVIGQPEAVELVRDLLATVKAALNRPRKPIASLLFIGPTGVGKTEMAKALAEFFFSSRDRISRFDMSEFASPAAVERLVGGSFGAEGLLTAKVREQPFSVILLDEFEKAYPSFFDLLLQALGEGRLTDAAGRVADFSNAIVVMTSNLGAESFGRGAFGLTGVHDDPAKRDDNARSHFTDAVRSFLRPELFNRIDRIVPFLPLDEASIRMIAGRELQLIAQRDGLRLRGIGLQTDEEALQRLAERGYHVQYGARPLKRAIERELLVPLADSINRYAEGMKLAAQATTEASSIRVTVRPQSAADAAAAKDVPDAAEISARAARASEIRRHLQRLHRCNAVLAMRNELFRIERTIERANRQRAKKQALRGSSGQALRGSSGQARFVPLDPRVKARLDRLQPASRRLDGLLAEICQFEDRAMEGVYEEHPSGTADHLLHAEIAGAEAEWRDLLLAIYSLRFADPERIIVAVYGENRETVFRLAQAYFETIPNGPDCVEVYSFEPYGSRDALRRRRVETAVEFLADPQSPTIGIALVIRSPEARARFESEGGLHVFVEGGHNFPCLVDISPAFIADYRPPQKIEVKGTIGRGERRRTYQVEQKMIEDPTISNRPTWSHRLCEALAESMRISLNDKLLAMEGS